MYHVIIYLDVDYITVTGDFGVGKQTSPDQCMISVSMRSSEGNAQVITSFQTESARQWQV